MNTIPPTSPAPDGHALGARIGLAARLWRRAVDQRLQPYGLTQATWRPLLQLARAPEALRQKELAQALGLDNSAVVRVLDALAAAGLIERKGLPDDRRARAIVLTPAGLAMVEQVTASAADVLEKATAGIAAEDLATAEHVLARICARLSDADDIGEAARP
ncbi:MarR family transcriptional regulator [Verticiella sediminum]|uniref:MarR family transcriptional regulator n=1 Tax=Verticiella sediminum TaxID=1247510 RepID=A0A556AY97_9BURK|nr:MarR family transcriptional regulator [Verticiella sediminum]TSH97924.1 MarR family transcriptional regulator [Verticiella sediminum]